MEGSFHDHWPNVEPTTEPLGLQGPQTWAGHSAPPHSYWGVDAYSGQWYPLTPVQTPHAGAVALRHNHHLYDPWRAAASPFSAEVYAQRGTDWQHGPRPVQAPFVGAHADSWSPAYSQPSASQQHASGHSDGTPQPLRWHAPNDSQSDASCGGTIGPPPAMPSQDPGCGNQRDAWKPTRDTGSAWPSGEHSSTAGAGMRGTASDYRGRSLRRGAWRGVRGRGNWRPARGGGLPHRPGSDGRPKQAVASEGVPCPGQTPSPSKDSALTGTDARKRTFTDFRILGFRLAEMDWEWTSPGGADWDEGGPKLKSRVGETPAQVTPPPIDQCRTSAQLRDEANATGRPARPAAPRLRICFHPLDESGGSGQASRLDPGDCEPTLSRAVRSRGDDVFQHSHPSLASQDRLHSPSATLGSLLRSPEVGAYPLSAGEP